MKCKRSGCEEAESRIDGYCSMYCRDVDEAWCEVARVKKELDDLRCKQIAALEAENKRLKKAIVEYGVHKPYCLVVLANC